MARREHTKAVNAHPARLSFWGGVGTVTGSKYLVETQKSRILVDCGLFQGQRELRERNWEDPPFDPLRLDAVVLTHAHLDHIGYLPRIVALGYRGPIHCSRATAELARLILEDSAQLQEEEAEWRNAKGLSRHTPALPLYDKNDVKRTLKLFRSQRSQTDGFRVTDDITVRWWPAGHILGARSLRLEIENAGAQGETRTILFSGDVGRKDQPILPDPQPPVPSDYVLIESTYGDRRHEPEDPVEQLAALVREAQKSGSAVLIPAFSVGRTQDILYHLRELEDTGRIPIIPVRADSPMAGEATKIYLQLAEEHDEETQTLLADRRNPLRTHTMRVTSTSNESRQLNEEQGARIILSASGMMTGGRVLHHARRILPDSNAIICFVGFQAAGTIGRRILDGETEVRIFKEWVPVRCKVVKIAGFSAHADYEELLDWMTPLKRHAPKQVFVTHGEPEAAVAMKEHIVERFGFRTQVPAYGETVTLE